MFLIRAAPRRRKQKNAAPLLRSGVPAYYSGDSPVARLLFANTAFLGYLKLVDHSMAPDTSLSSESGRRPFRILDRLRLTIACTIPRGGNRAVLLDGRSLIAMEARSIPTASATTHSSDCGNFLRRCELPPIGGCVETHSVSAETASCGKGHMGPSVCKPARGLRADRRWGHGIRLNKFNYIADLHLVRLGSFLDQHLHFHIYRESKDELV